MRAKKFKERVSIRIPEDIREAFTNRLEADGRESYGGLQDLFEDWVREYAVGRKKALNLPKLTPKERSVLEAYRRDTKTKATWDALADRVLKKN